MRHGTYDFRRAVTLYVDNRAQDRKAEVAVTGFGRLIEPVGKFAPPRQRAMPFAGVMDDPAKMPLRRFQREQGKRCVGPCARLNELLEALKVPGPPDGRQAPACVANDLRKKCGRDMVGVTKPVGKAG